MYIIAHSVLEYSSTTLNPENKQQKKGAAKYSDFKINNSRFLSIFPFLIYSYRYCLTMWKTTLLLKQEVV